jgi:hypothetical protein
MLPDAVARLRARVGFDDPVASQLLLSAMSSGVACILIDPDPTVTIKDLGGANWLHFVSRSEATQERTAKNIETLFREPEVRLRLAR